MCGTDAHSTVLSVSDKAIILRIQCNNSRCGLSKITKYNSDSCNVSFDDMNKALESAVNSWNHRCKFIR